MEVALARIFWDWLPRGRRTSPIRSNLQRLKISAVACIARAWVAVHHAPYITRRSCGLLLFCVRLVLLSFSTSTPLFAKDAQLCSYSGPYRGPGPYLTSDLTRSAVRWPAQYREFSNVRAAKTVAAVSLTRTYPLINTLHRMLSPLRRAVGLEVFGLPSMRSMSFNTALL